MDTSTSEDRRHHMTASEKTFFVSYSHADRPWAEWIAWQVEEGGHRAIIYDWDFQVGENFILRMDEASKADGTIALISADYLASPYCHVEWATAFHHDVLKRHRLLPVRIAACDIDGLLGTRRYIDLVGLGHDEARSGLIQALDGTRPKPQVEPPYPGRVVEPHFPAQSAELPLARDAVQVGHVPLDFTLIGRESEVTRLVKNLMAKPVTGKPLRPTPVIGAPGVGKSAVCIKALHHRKLSTRFGNRRYFLRCNGALSADAVVTMVASALGLRTGTADPLPQVRALLAMAPAVLVLDNADTPWEADPGGTVRLLRTLVNVPKLALVASFRGRQIPDDVPWRAPIEVEPLDRDAGRRLFISIAGPRYAEDPRLDELVRLQDGLPLTIDLLARQAGDGPDLADLWQRWHRLDADDVTGDIGVTFEVSINSPRTTPAARRLLALLGVLPDGIALDDLDVLVPGEGGDAAGSLRGVGLATDEEYRIRTLQPIAEYVRRHYPPEPEDLGRAAVHYRRRGEELGSQGGAPGGAEASARLSAEIGNLDAMLHLGFADADPTPSIDAAVAIASFIRFSGLGSTRLLESARKAAERIHDDRRQALTLSRMGHVAFVRTEHDVAAGRFQAALRLFDQVHDEPGRADCIRGLAHVDRAEGRPLEARSRYEAARRIFMRAGDLVGQADAVAGLADLAFDEGDMTLAQRGYEEAQPLYDRSRHPRGVANCIADLGWIAYERGQYDPARGRLKEARPLYEGVGHLHGIAKCELGIAHVDLAVGKHDRADTHYRKAQRLYLQVGARKGQIDATFGLAHVARAKDCPDDASRHFASALEVASGASDPGLVRMVVAAWQASGTQGLEQAMAGTEGVTAG
ncbi:MAG TPA: TIR domain-containing protein [Actinoplanes sp.]